MPGRDFLVGNDVVDLSRAGSRCHDLRFLDRVLQEGERKFVLERPEETFRLWALWAAKESAFKIARKIEPGARFLYREFEAVVIRLVSRRRCNRLYVRIAHRGLQAAVRVRADRNHLHALAVSPPVPEARLAALPLACGLHELQGEAGPEECSRRVRECVIRDISARFRVAPGRLQAVRQRRAGRLGPPQLWLDGEPQGCVDLSLSHHGSWLAWAYLFPPALPPINPSR